MILFFVIFTGCAHDEGKRREDAAHAVELPTHDASVNRGQPIENAGLARDLAELVLAESGIDVRRFAASVSFTDGAYHVAFTNQLPDGGTVTFTVVLDSRTSKTLSIKRTTKPA
ncbi:MAG: hypothetical protein D6806_08345, partial [Deltaproteobacteria bacterium]